MKTGFAGNGDAGTPDDLTGLGKRPPLSARRVHVGGIELGLPHRVRCTQRLRTQVLEECCNEHFTYLAGSVSVR